MNQPPVSNAALKKVIAAIPSRKIMVIGDIMLDEYLWGEVRRISPEAPVPVLEVEASSDRLGGAANVVQNLASLGVEPTLISICGSDAKGRDLKRMLEEIGCRTDGLVFTGSRPTTVKTRIMAKQQQIVRVDREVRRDLSGPELKKIIQNFDRQISEVHGVIVSDYDKGVISKDFIAHIITTCRKLGVFMAIDPKERHFDLYQGVDVITPNLKETLNALGVQHRHFEMEEIIELGWRLADKLELKYLLLTLSERGMAVYERSERRVTHLPTVARKVFDVTGAGDTVIGVFTAAMAAGALPATAAFIANHAAGVTVGELGTASVDLATLLRVCLCSDRP
jgi:rfaE bifunctional protein kinase chain/domain